MSPRNYIPGVLLLLPFFLFMSSEEGHHASDPMEFVGKLVNFLVLFGLLTFLLHKPIRRFLEERGVKIDRTIQEIHDSRQGAEAKLKEAKQRLEKMSDEIRNIGETSELEGKKEKDRILKLSLQEAQRLKQLAQQEIERLSQASVDELKAYAARTATARARKRILKKMTPEIHSLLIDKSIEKFEELYEKSSSG